MMELTRTLTFLGSLERLPPGFTWSNVAVPIIWASASEAGMEVVRGCLGSHGISDYPAELMQRWWQAQGVQDEEAATRALRARARGTHGEPRLPYDYLSGPLQEDVMEEARAAGPLQFAVVGHLFSPDPGAGHNGGALPRAVL